MPPSVFATGLVAILALPFVILSFAQGVSTGLIALLLAVAALVAGAMATRGHVEADAEGLTYTSGFRTSRLPWSQIAGLGLIEVRGAGTDWYEVYLRDGDAMRFTSHWRNGERVAACIQRRSVTDAPLDRRGPIVFDPATDTSNARPDAAGELGTTWPQLHRWLDAAEQALGDLGRLERRQLQITGDDGVVELFSLARRTLPLPDAEWPAAIRQHREQLAAVREEQAAWERDAADLSRVRDRLRPQVHPIDRIDTIQQHVVGRLGPHLRLFLVGDLGHAEAIVTRERLQAWGVPAADLLAEAVGRLGSDPAPQRAEKDGTIVFAGDDRTAARALRLSELVDLDPRYGALVGLPGQGALIVHPLRDMADLFVLLGGGLGNVARAAFETDARPLTPELYWWFRGELVHVPAVRNAEGGLTWVVPDDLSGRLTGRVEG